MATTLLLWCIQQSQIMDRLFERAFNQAAASANAELDRHERKRKAAEPDEADEEEALRNMATPMERQDAIQRVLLADKDKDYFR